MKDEIKRILEMYREGRLSMEEVEALIDALNDREDHRKERGRSGGKEEPDTPEQGDTKFDSFDSVFGKEFGEAMAGFGSWFGGNIKSNVARAVGPKTWGDKSNRMTMSKAEPPVSDASTCSGNSISVSHLSGIELKEASFCNNVFSASKARRFRIIHGSYNRNALQGGALEDVRVVEGAIEDTAINGTKSSSIHLASSTIRKNSWSGTSIKDLYLKNDSHLHDSSLSGVSLRKILLENSRLEECAFTGLHLRDVSIQESKLIRWKLSGLSIQRSSILRSEMNDVAFVASNRPFSEWRIKGLTIEEMKMDGCRFANCGFSGTKLIGFCLKDLNLTNVDFSDRTITSLHEFLRIADIPA